MVGTVHAVALLLCITIFMRTQRVLVYSLCNHAACPWMQVWRRQDNGKWEHVQSPGAGDLKASVAEYVKQQEVHTQSVVRQRHSVAMRQVCALFARVSDDVTSHSRYLADIVAGFKSDPSAGASKVTPHLGPAPRVLVAQQLAASGSPRGSVRDVEATGVARHPCSAADGQQLPRRAACSQSAIGARVGLAASGGICRCKWHMSMRKQRGLGKTAC